MMFLLPISPSSLRGEFARGTGGHQSDWCLADEIHVQRLSGGEPALYLACPANAGQQFLQYTSCVACCCHRVDMILIDMA